MIGAARAVMVALSLSVQAVLANTACDTRAEWLALDAPLPHVRMQIERSAPLLLVAIGSSSTAGEGASSAARTYPARLEALLTERYPALAVRVVNSGKRGEYAQRTGERLARDVVALAPQLVLWQLGANDALRSRSLEEFNAAIDTGLAVLRTAGIDVVLIPPQYAPRVVAVPALGRYVDAIERAGREFGVGYFKRFAILRDAAAKSADALGRYVGPDGLHHTDLGYECLAEQLDEAIGRSAH